MKRLLLITFLLCLLAACTPAADPAVETITIEVTSTPTETTDPRLNIEQVAPSADGECSHACQLSLVSAYFAALDTVYRADSTQEDIEQLFTLFHEDVQYKHLDYGANFDKTAWQTAFSNNLQRGVYTNDANETIGILNVIHGKNHTAVAYAYGTEDEDGNWTQDGEELLALFGFEGNKIILIRELW